MTELKLIEPAPDDVVELRRQKFEAGRYAFEEIALELRAKQHTLNDTTVELQGIRAELDALQIAYVRAQGEIDLYREERDKAVLRRAELEVILDAVLSVLHRYQAPPAPDPETNDAPH